jgi:hypothetical protein
MRDSVFVKLVVAQKFNGLWYYDHHNWNVQGFCNSHVLCRL